MEYDEFASRIDHTVLGPTTTLADVRRALDEAVHYGTNACVPPCYVEEAAAYAPDVTLVTVIGFPHGHHAPAAKRAEAVDAVDHGADELDVVINVGRLKSGDLDAVEADLAAVVDAVSVPVKAIVETGLLGDDELRRACEAARDAGADFAKTSTGFADGGATAADVATMAEYLPVKASGGVGSYDDAMAMFDAGAHRVGASSGVALVEGFPGPGGPAPDADAGTDAD